GFHRPDFHLAEALAAVLRLAAQRLLGDEGVGPNRTGVNLVCNEVAQLEHVDLADDDALVKAVTGASIVQVALAVLVEAGLLEILADLLFLNAVEHRGGDLEAER